MYSYIYISYVLWQHRHVIYNVYYYGSLVYSFAPSFKVEVEDESWVAYDMDDEYEIIDIS